MDFDPIDSLITAQVDESTLGMILRQHLLHGKGGEVPLRILTRDDVRSAVLPSFSNGA